MTWLILASIWTVTHLVAHLTILAGYFLAPFRVAGAFLSLIHVSLITVTGGACFFAFCGLTHLGLALNQPTAIWVTVTDHLQAVAIWVFLISLAVDLDRAQARLSVAWRQLRDRHGDLMDDVEEQVSSALQKKAGW